MRSQSQAGIDINYTVDQWIIDINYTVDQWIIDINYTVDQWIIKGRQEMALLVKDADKGHGSLGKPRVW